MTTAEQLQTRLTTTLTSNDKLQTQIEMLQKSLETERVTTLEQMWAKSGGQVIEAAGEKFKIIEKVIINTK